MSVTAQPATKSAKGKDAFLATAFILASVAIPVFLWPSDGTVRDQLLRVFLIGWAACGLLLAGISTAPAFRNSASIAPATLWLGLGLIVGLGLGTIPWTDLTSGPVWQIWLTFVLSIGYLQQLQRRRA
ncbi:hypothetical protein RCH07_003512 [Arthrobacter sp. CG_A4]|nr:hypothetical protein [Arthrobacter sp. CG_A4]